jgi:hypothetical protein
MSPLSSLLRLSLSCLCFVTLALVAGCKGETVVKDNPETAAKLKACADKANDKDTLIATYEADLAKLKLAATPSNEIVLVIEGETLAIKPRPAGSGTPVVDDKVAIELSQQYVELVKKSRGNIQKCYEQALKKNSSLQSRTIPLTVTSKFAASGAVGKATFTPTLDADFANCMQGVSTRWKLPPTAAGMSFQSTVTLSPS